MRLAWANSPRIGPSGNTARRSGVSDRSDVRKYDRILEIEAELGRSAIFINPFLQP
jgi:hypothetical protein